MSVTITISKLELYNKYSDDIDGFLRINKGREKEVFGDDFPESWYAISNKIQDVALIANRKASQDYTNKTLDELAEMCDTESFDAFTSKIQFYASFQKIAGILQQIKSYIHSETDTIWTYITSVDVFLKELDQDIEAIKHCNFDTLHKINIEFAPTSTYQECSMSNGWSDDYLKLAEKFDYLLEEIKGCLIDSKNKKTR